MKRLSLSPIYFLCFYVSFASAAVRVYNQCGGSMYNGDTECEAGTFCLFEDPKYSNCFPANKGVWNPTGHQCDGAGYTSPTPCPKGTTCTVFDQYASTCEYIQCDSKKCPSGTKCQLDGDANVCVPEVGTIETVPVGKQCGGKDYKGPTTCESGAKCQFKNAKTSICVNSNSQLVPKGHQCDGENYSGSKKCADGLTCQRQITRGDFVFSLCLVPPRIIPDLGRCYPPPVDRIAECVQGSQCNYVNQTLSLCIPTFANNGEQCADPGNPDYFGPRLCKSGLICQFKLENDRFPVCLPEVLKTYGGQCGGTDYLYKGSTKCEAGLTCQRINPSISRCYPLQKLNQQCGGVGYEGPVACEQGTTCQAQNSTVSSCLPVNPDCSPRWGLCGTKIGNKNGKVCCQAGSTCTPIDEFYDQCL